MKIQNALNVSQRLYIFSRCHKHISLVTYKHISLITLASLQLNAVIPFKVSCDY